jgi:hypothetical protein
MFNFNKDGNYNLTRREMQGYDIELFKYKIPYDEKEAQKPIYERLK